MAERDKFFSLPLRLPKELDRLFDELIHRPWGMRVESLEWNPSVDLYETAESYVLEADLPGVKAEDVKADVQGDTLILAGRRFSERTRHGGRFFCQERSFGHFSRRIAIPASIDKDKIKFEFDDGVLRVTLPKLKRKAGSS